MTKPNEPTLTCSEVVERLAKCMRFHAMPDGTGGHKYATFDREQATAILHSWRERRVQELEEARNLLTQWLGYETGMIPLTATRRFLASQLLTKHSLTPEPQSTQPDTTKEKRMTTEIRTNQDCTKHGGINQYCSVCMAELAEKVAIDLRPKRMESLDGAEPVTTAATDSENTK